MRSVFYLNGSRENMALSGIGLFVMIADYNYYIHRLIGINGFRDYKSYQRAIPVVN